ncbi:TPA: CGNR zinc finger domain-containing protein [Legionella pneumophila]|nr:CGNR zinc finger domain-containing protein [Legionella pneumophila]AGN14155.1 hypothetical protein LP6_1243 [Legionella pneumophila subsp. pneumophila str. Thunder Bay]OOK41297.1 hypothetical protein LPS_1651 [Legionella pneumophila subsp. pneumophila str. Sudbury]WAI62732.1 CGNR zinc finger domain-containing protein [Legionella pneumophila]WAI77498.1 CGNR zinc finger domain-containing protein [Legionella pneumophila]CZH11227.1 Uncharacterised protein [Legionella pneumophila]
MEKTLHDYFCINTGEELKFYSAKESSFLVEAANFHIDRGNGIDAPNTLPELDAIIYECMDEYFKNGLTDYLLNKLNEILINVKIQCLVENMENKLSAIHVAYIPKKPSPVVFGAYMFSHVTSLSGLEGLKRCYNKGCLKFFIGRSNAKWCSSSCGSKYRVNKMRKKKKVS